MFHNRDRVGGGPAAAEEPSTIGFVLRGAYRITFDNYCMNAPDRSIPAGSLAAIGQNRVFSGDKFRLDKEIAERRMSGVGRWWYQHNLSVTGNFDLSDTCRIVGQRNTPDLGVVFSRNDNLHVRINTSVAATKVSFVF